MWRKETELEPGDFHVAVKRREYMDAPLRWEIWAAGATMSEAMKQGKAALKALLQKIWKLALPSEIHQ